jgi:tetratricopeptide (TPR) repeat protein
LPGASGHRHRSARALWRRCPNAPLFAGRSTGGWLCLTLLAILASLTWQHAGAFRDDEALWNDTLAKNPGCWMAHHNLGLDLAARGQLEAASEHYRAALRLNADAEAHLGLGAVLDAQGKADEAAAHYLAAIKAKPDYAEAYNNLSNLLAKRGDAQQALRYAAEAVRLKPNYAEAHFNLGNALNLLGKTADAAAEYSTAARLKPDYAEAHFNLGGAMFLLSHMDEAAAHLAEAVRLQPANPAAHTKLAFVLTRQGKAAEALSQYQEALRLQPQNPLPLTAMAWILATHPDTTLRNGTEALRLAQAAIRLSEDGDARTLDALAAAYAETGRFDEAVKAARTAADSALARGDQEQANRIKARMALYQSGRAYREDPKAQPR